MRSIGNLARSVDSLLRLCPLEAVLAAASHAAPSVTKVEPPNWWVPLTRNDLHLAEGLRFQSFSKRPADAVPEGRLVVRNPKDINIHRAQLAGANGGK